MRRRVAGARVGRLATVSADGSPHVVPIAFAHEDVNLFFAVDDKPKRTRDLQRLRNIARNPRVSVLVDHYEDDWTRLWWVRVDGVAHVLVHDTEAERAIDLLARKYAQYRTARPPGPVIEITILRMTGWAAAENPAC